MNRFITLDAVHPIPRHPIVPDDPGLASNRKSKWPFWIFILLVIGTLLGIGADVFAGNLPGTDESQKLEAAGTLLRLVDTGLFKWGARLFAGLCIMSAAWSLKEQRFGISVICVVGAIVFGTAPKWVKNIFNIGGGDSIFSMTIDSPSHAIDSKSESFHV